MPDDAVMELLASQCIKETERNNWLGCWSNLSGTVDCCERRENDY